MTTSDLSTRALREAIDVLVEPRTWLRDDIIKALDKANEAVSIVSFYQRYFSRLVLAFEDPEDAELVDFLSSRMRESEEVVNAHVESQRDHLRHTIHDFLLGYLFLNATSYFHPIAEAYARRVGYRSEPMSCLNYAYFLAAHFHDLGYPVEFHRCLLEFARQIASDFPHVIHMERGSPMTYGSDTPLTSLFAWRAGLYGDAEGGKGYIPTIPLHAIREFVVNRTDHSLTAAFLLWDRAECTSRNRHGGEHNDERCFVPPVLRTAALACVSHNFQYYVEHSEWYCISLAHDPVSFLLQLVDESQDWSRERIDVDLLWGIGREVEKHRHSRAILCETPRVTLDESGRLNISYAVAVQPFLDDQEDPYQLARVRELLERRLIDRNRHLAGVLKMDKPGISVEGRYFIGPDYPSDLYEECTVRVAIGERKPRWKCQFHDKPDPFRVRLALEQAGAAEMVRPEPRAHVLIDPEGKLKPVGCTLGEGGARISLDTEGRVALAGLRGGTVYLLLGAGGVGKSTLLHHIAMNPPPPYSAFHLNVIPPGARELDFERAAERSKRLFLVDHFDHILAQPQAEYWKEEITRRLHVPEDAVLILACRTEVADEWPYAEARSDIRVLQTYREGYDTVRPEDFVREKLRNLRPSIRGELADLALQEKGERWIPVAEVPQVLRERAIQSEMMREVNGLLRFDHDYVQDALATLGILRAISHHDDNFNLGQQLVAHPPWVYVFLLWSLCGEKRGVSPFLDVGREAYLRRRRETLDRLLQSGRALLWLQHTGASDFGATGDGKKRLPIEELDEVLAKESGTVQPAHIGLVRDVTVTSLLHRLSGTRPPKKVDIKALVELALRFRDLDTYYASQPIVSARCRITRTYNFMSARAYVWSQKWPELHRQTECWPDWDR